VRLRQDDRIVTARGADPDTLVASAKAYLAALNKRERPGKPPNRPGGEGRLIGRRRAVQPRTRRPVDFLHVLL
jgi:hypothetical protein